MTPQKTYYFDNNATTRVAPEVVDAILPFLSDYWGNPSSVYRFGNQLTKHLEAARLKIATLINADPRELIFTSCGTESNNSAIHSALMTTPGKRHVLTTAVEHSSNVNFCESLAKRGYEVINLQGFSSPTAAAAYFPSRSSLSACYAQIMADLYAAINLLANNGRGASTGINYASKHAALALGARIKLYQGDWAKADSFATAAITLSGGLGLMNNTSNYVAGWRAANHPEAIFQVLYATLTENLGVNTSLAATHTTLRTSGALLETRQGQGDLMPNGFLMSQLGISGFPAGLASTSPPPTLTYSNDIRNRLFEWGVNAGGHYVECTKWLGKNGGANWDNTVVLRWPELYLNRAEARYQMGQEALAWADLNIIRTARYVGFVVPGVQDFTGAALLNEILRQRMLEFSFEGLRFYDLKRYGLTITKTNPVVSLPATDFRLLPRIPQNEVDGNVNMVQNFGY